MSKKLYLVVFSIFIGVASSAQTSALLEACNSTEDSNKRLACFEEIIRIQKNSDRIDNSEEINSTSINRAKGTFVSMQSAVQSGVSYNQYSQLLLEPAKELGLLKIEAPTLHPSVVRSLEQAMNAYRDAKFFWQASISHSTDGGVLMGRVLLFSGGELARIVKQYKLTTTLNDRAIQLPPDAALSKIWNYAENRTKLAFDIAAGLDVPDKVLDKSPEITGVGWASEAELERLRSSCDRWGNPHDNHGNPCIPK